ncbi:flagellar motor switch protein FliN [Zhongshania aliphaticivorans]|uniref:flagellar motor switch protein FliN n=1 Tax=Zhongshania aliphaticivorans TaxID=1470434 RepID=UPI0012E5A311|nr:flagellar motor switch protein FliN [Zhongshania aliphaticivorans]CAA0105133.1 Flagellar motor switch protein FliN [Zhongshania aliphaticivorans]
MTDQINDEQISGGSEAPQHQAATKESAILTEKNATHTKTERTGSGRMTKDMSLDMIMDVNVSVAVEVGRTKMSIRDLRDLNQGAIIELDRAAGTPLDVLVNGTLVARGEIVVVKDKYGIMLTEVVGQDDRERH